jgi:hypothetical protein
MKAVRCEVNLMAKSDFDIQILGEFTKKYGKDGLERYDFSVCVAGILKKAGRALFRKEIDDRYMKIFSHLPNSNYYQEITLNPDINIITVKDLRKDVPRGKRVIRLSDAKATQKIYYLSEDQLKPLKKY